MQVVPSRARILWEDAEVEQEVPPSWGSLVGLAAPSVSPPGLRAFCVASVSPEAL